MTDQDASEGSPEGPGLGAIQSPPDERDYDISQLYAAAGIDVPLTLAAAYQVPSPAPVINQGSTPQCVAYSASSMKSFQDRDDQPTATWFNFDEGLFFQQIGGGVNGAVIRNAMVRLKGYGYPLVGNAAAASKHKVAAYYSVPTDVLSIKQAIATFGECVLGVHWFRSWFHPNTAGVLPAPDTIVGGHAIVVKGWDDTRKAFRLRNSWGTDWGQSGECWLPYAYLPAGTFECWKTSDTAPLDPITAKYGVRPSGAVGTIDGLSMTIYSVTSGLYKVIGTGAIHAWVGNPATYHWALKPAMTGTLRKILSGGYTGRFMHAGTGTFTKR